MKYTNENSDETLMISFQSESHEAFEVLFERYKGRVYSFIKRRINIPEDAEEIFQQVFVKLTNSRHTYKKEFKFAQWLFTICKSTIADFLRKKRITGQLNLEVDDIEGVNIKAGMENREFKILSTELTNTQRTIIEMRVFDELTYEEISDKLEISPTNVRQILSRSFKKLRLALNAKGGDIE